MRATSPRAPFSLSLRSEARAPTYLQYQGHFGRDRQMPPLPIPVKQVVVQQIETSAMKHTVIKRASCLPRLLIV